MEKLLKIRNEKKKKKPEFLRRDHNKKSRLAKKWHKPKGLHNKMRLNKKGNPKPLSSGYRSPAAVKGLTKGGLRPIVVSTIDELSALDAKTQLAILASGLGQRKRAALVSQAKKLQLTIKNIKNLEEYLSFVESEMRTRKENKQKKISEKDQKVKEAEKKAKQKEADAKTKEKAGEKKDDLQKVTEEKEEQQKKKQEKDKVLTKRV